MIMDLAYTCIVMGIMCVLICGDTNAPLKPALPAQTDGSSKDSSCACGRVAHKSDLLKPPPVGVSFRL